MLAVLRHDQRLRDMAGGNEVSSSSTVRRWVLEVVDLLAARAPRLDRAPKKIARRGGAVVLLDGTLVRTHRRTGPDNRKNYNGKHKAHGLLVLALTDEKGNLIWTSSARPGRASEITAARHDHITRHLREAGLGALADLGFVGLDDPDDAPVIITGRKATRSHRLTNAEKEANQLVSHERAAVEHGFANLKTWRILTKVRMNVQHATTLLRALLVLANHEVQRWQTITRRRSLCCQHEDCITDSHQYLDLRVHDETLSLLLTRLPTATDGRALDVGCGTGELAAHLSSSGCAVDAVDWSETALADARARHGDAARWLRLDIEEDYGGSLHPGGYDLITLRFVAPFLRSLDRTLDALGRRPRPGGALVLITPLASAIPDERRGVTLAEDELARLRNRWAGSERHDAKGLVLLVLRRPSQDETPPHVAARRTPSSAHHFHLTGRHYGQLEAGRKTIEARVATSERPAVEAGDTVVFHDRSSDRELDIIVKRTTWYASFEDLLGAEDPARIDPDRPPDGLLVELRGDLCGIHPPAEEALGAVAIEFDHRPPHGPAAPCR
ncbi:transposase family protein [Streptomyces sp. CRN 30]|uniref:transposase family protein n=1 Tax=Streptomyces sp. CRN 30 TaxID=3075613 RepID=UPI002A81CEC7|nr:transposase family protein [Streptomyces sp. CRN 30]